MKSERGKFGSNLVAGISEYGPEAHAATLRPQGLNHWVLNLTLEGRGRINSGPDLFHAEVGDVLLFPPNQPHDYSWEEERRHWSHLWIYFSPMAHWAPLLNWPRKGGPVLGFTLPEGAPRDKVKAAMERALEFFRSPLNSRLQFCANALEEALLWCDTANPFAHRSGGDDRVRTAVAFMMKNFAQPMNVERMARECNLSVSRFAHLFQSSMGESPSRYLESLRIWKAQELLIGTAKSVKEISQEVGFGDPLYFSRVFRRKLNLSPRAFRKDSQQE